MENENQNENLGQIKILSLEDEEFFNIFLRDSLIVYSPQKVDFDFASSKKEFFYILNKENTQKPDIIFLCLAVSDENGGRLKMQGGFDVLKTLKESPEFKNIPVYIFSRYNEEGLKKKARQLGAERYLVKGECMPKDIADIVTGDYKESVQKPVLSFFDKIFGVKNK